MSDERYCTECGKMLSPTDRFCPACGAMIRDIDEYEAPEPGSVVTTVCVDDRSGTLTNVKFATLIWGVLALAIGLYSLICAQSLTDQFVTTMKDMAYDSGKTYWDMFVEMGYNSASIESELVFSGALFSISGAFCLVSTYFMHIQQYYRYAMLTLIVGVMFSIYGILTFLIGITVVYYLKKCKDVFQS